MTCLAQHVGSDGDGGPDGGVDAKEGDPEQHASPHGQVGELQRVETGWGWGWGSDRKCERREEIKPRGRRDGNIGHIVCMHHRPNIYTTLPSLPPPPGAASL